jgi:hypothetical protein
MTALFENGFTILKLYEKDEIETISSQFLETALNSRELVPDMNHTKFVLGGVGYVPFASLWYDPIVREITKKAYETVLKKNVFGGIMENTKYISMLPDRPLIRFPGQKVNEKGKWHQDDAANSVEDIDTIFGGWINLNSDVTQYFKAIPKTHKNDHPIFDNLIQKNGGKRGYANFTSETDQKFLKKYWESNIKTLIEIPPGHMLIFEETLIHTVFPNPPIDKPILRLHTSFNISSSNVPLHDRPFQAKHRKNRKLKDLFKDQELVPVRSGQNTPLYSPFNLFPNNAHAVDELSNHYISACKKNNRVMRFLPSLKEISEISTNISMHPPMTEQEISYYVPHLLEEKTIV